MPNKQSSLQTRAEAIGYDWEEDGDTITLSSGPFVAFVGKKDKVENLVRDVEKRQ